LLLLAIGPRAFANQATVDAAEDALAQQRIADRFLAVLERNPRRGTALDKVYGFHVENGSLESFVKLLHDRTAARPDDGTSWMILGLIENQRGHDAAAAAALTKASEPRPTDPLAAYYLGQSLILVGQPDKAITALENALARTPSPSDVVNGAPGPYCVGCIDITRSK
jgi:Flp pilus assembly protein TadD